ncbi:MAG: diguanylate cyclase [Pseudomonadales bacterium]|nr:diguanylate cyclase [Pseudomonadales bacterium]
MGNLINWKSRYAEMVDQQEKQQGRYRKKNSLMLAALSSVLSLARDIDDAETDQKLLALQGLLRQDKITNVDLEQAVRTLANRAKSSMDSRQQKLTKITGDLKRLSKSVREIAADPSIVNSLKQFEKNLAGKKKSYAELPALLEQLVSLHKSAINELNDNLKNDLKNKQNIKPKKADGHSDQRSLWQRWFGSSSGNPGAALSDAMSDATHAAELQNEQTEYVPVLTSSLAGLMDQIRPPEDVKVVYDEVCTLLESSPSIVQLPALVNSVCEVVSATLQNDQQEFENFLSKLNKKIQHANNNLATSQSMWLEEVEAGNQLNQSIRQAVGRIQSNIESVTEIDQLKAEVSNNLDQMVSIIDQHQKDGLSRHQSLSEELNALSSRAKQMEQATRDAEVKIEEQRQRALTDSLTRLPNREFYQQRARQEVARWHRYERPLCLAVCDIDFFKMVNDNHGHVAGDEVLKQVADIIKNRLRESDFVARYGGEEFVVLLPETEREQAFAVMDSVREGIDMAPFEFAGEDIPVSISIGIVNFKGKDILGSAFARADKALYRAKGAGRNCCIIADA